MDMTQSHTWTLLIYMSDMTHAHACHDSSRHANYMSLLQNIVSFIGSFAEETYNFKDDSSRNADNDKVVQRSHGSHSHM